MSNLIILNNHFSLQACRIISILKHYFFTSCFMFMLLESMHVYSLVAFVVYKDGLMTRLQVGKFIFSTNLSFDNHFILKLLKLKMNCLTLYQFQNLAAGWGIPAALVVACVACNYEDYGGEVYYYFLSHGKAGCQLIYILYRASIKSFQI